MFAQTETVRFLQLEISAKIIFGNQKLQTLKKLETVAFTATLPLGADKQFTGTAQFRAR